MKLCILLACAFAYLGYVQVAGLLFPHMANNGDTELVPRYDDTYVFVQLICSYRFYCTSHSSVYIGTNGYVTFGGGLATFFPQLMSVVTNWDVTMIAPLFSDNYLDNTPPANHIWYRETQNLAMLTKANDIIQAQFPCCGGPWFEATWVLIVTWQRVKSYCEVKNWSDCMWNRAGISTRDHYEDLKPEAERLEKDLEHNFDDDRGMGGINGYQLVLATDGYQTYAIFNMHTIEWDCCWDWNTSGFSAGDSNRSCDLPGSGTATIGDLTSTSNVGKDGRWVYRVDTCDVLNPDCSVC